MSELGQYRRKKRVAPLQPMQLAWNRWVDELSDSTRLDIATTLRVDDCRHAKFNISYTKYDNLMLINKTVFSRGILAYITEDAELSKSSRDLWKCIAEAFNVTHVGVVAPIPIDISDDQSKSVTCKPDTNSSKLDNGSNVLRSPVSFRPLYGDFGPPEASQWSFSAENAERVFWAKATQFKIVQMWSPLYTMFSQGNVKEKERILQVERSAHYSTAVDLYAGIGYFAFCYRKQVAAVVLGWEINPWSVEGFRRGAGANGWQSELQIIQEDEAFDGRSGIFSGYQRGDYEDAGSFKKGLVLFAESNVKAYDRVRAMRDEIPPVRHVNCGFLPTSEPSWETAIRIIDPVAGGWIRVHENMAIADIQTRAEQIVERFRELAEKHGISKQLPHVSCSCITRVKTYAPGVMHCVVDVRLDRDNR